MRSHSVVRDLVLRRLRSYRGDITKKPSTIPTVYSTVLPVATWVDLQRPIAGELKGCGARSNSASKASAEAITTRGNTSSGILRLFLRRGKIAGLASQRTTRGL